jgi:hypothetical protein
MGMEEIGLLPEIRLEATQRGCHYDEFYKKARRKSYSREG